MAEQLTRGRSRGNHVQRTNELPPEPLPVLLRTTLAEEPYFIESQTPPRGPDEYWQTIITGPFVNIRHMGTTQRCGPDTVRMLNVAYRAGARSESARPKVTIEQARQLEAPTEAHAASAGR